MVGRLAVKRRLINPQPKGSATVAGGGDAAGHSVEARGTALGSLKDDFAHSFIHARDFIGRSERGWARSLFGPCKILNVVSPVQETFFTFWEITFRRERRRNAIRRPRRRAP